uniref:Uncharacterized protein n=1 Tax=Aegilops tauschii subsp. strangulata TaxID=200361 RepID=A0A453LXS4_AEGTS
HWISSHDSQKHGPIVLHHVPKLPIWHGEKRTTKEGHTYLQTRSAVGLTFRMSRRILSSNRSDAICLPHHGNRRN